MACDAQSLISAAYAAGYAALSDRDLREALVATACAGGGGGGGGGGTCGNFAGVAPNFTPTTGCGWAIDTSNNRLWWYYSGAWH